MVRAYSLLEHEDANDQDEGDQVGGDPHETVLVRGLWTDGPQPASSHGWSRPGLQTKGPWAGESHVTIREGQRRTWRGLGGLRLYFVGVGLGFGVGCVCRIKEICAVFTVEVVCFKPRGFMCLKGLNARTKI